MIQYVYAFYNRKVGAYNPPIFSPLDEKVQLESVTRAFALAKPEDKILMADCDYYYLGEYDDHTGSFNLETKPKFLTNFGLEGD